MIQISVSAASTLQVHEVGGSYHPDVPLHFLERSELYDTVKPYNFHYFPKQIFPLHNIKHDVQTVCVRSMRPLVSTLSIDTQGFEVHKLATEMTYEDFMDEDVVRSKYFKELECHLKEKLGAHEVRALDSQVCLAWEKAFTQHSQGYYHSCD